MAAAVMRMVAVAMVLLAPAISLGQNAKQSLQRGKAEFNNLNYGQAIDALKNVPEDPTLSEAERKDALEILGVSNIALGDEPAAEHAFRKLLKIDPDHELRFHDDSPKIIEVFERLRGEVTPVAQPIRLDHERPGRARAGKSLPLAVRVVSGAKEVGGITIYYRVGIGRYRRVPTVPQPDGRYRGSLPVPEGAESLDYYFSAENVAGGQVARLGGPDDPFSLSLGRGGSSATPWYARWYVWLGGAALMGAGAALVVTQSGETPEGTLDPGRVTLSP